MYRFQITIDVREFLVNRGGKRRKGNFKYIDDLVSHTLNKIDFSKIK